MEAYLNNQIKFLVLDIDGVLTDGGMYYSESGDEFKKFNTKDGMGIKSLTKDGFLVAFLSNGKNKNMIESRAALLQVPLVYVGQASKMEILSAWLQEYSLEWEQVAYVGDDVNDLEVMQKVGLSACPSDAVDKIKSVSKVILNRCGGDACVREFIDQFIKSV